MVSGSGLGIPGSTQTKGTLWTAIQAGDLAMWGALTPLSLAGLTAKIPCMAPLRGDSTRTDSASNALEVQFRRRAIEAMNSRDRRLNLDAARNERAELQNTVPNVRINVPGEKPTFTKRRSDASGKSKIVCHTLIIIPMNRIGSGRTLKAARTAGGPTASAAGAAVVASGAPGRITRSTSDMTTPAGNRVAGDIIVSSPRLCLAGKKLTANA